MSAPDRFTPSTAFTAFTARGVLTGTLLLALAACGGDAPGTDGADGQDGMDPAVGTDAARGEAADVASASDALLDPNDASRDGIAAVEGMTPAAADALIAGRPYDDMLAVDDVLDEHIGEGERETVYGSLWKRIDLNGASEEEILLIPGVGDRMAHEFDEYRPYRAIEVFRREIGKYVDEEEVARLEQYVEIRE